MPSLPHHVLEAVGAEDAHQVVFERQEEARRAGVALAAAAAAQLVVDAPRLVALGADDVEAAGGEDLLLVLRRLRAVSSARQLLRTACLALGISLRAAARRGLGIAAEHDVGAAAGHVGRDRDGARRARLGDDLGLALVELGVQDDVRDLPCS